MTAGNFETPPAPRELSETEAGEALAGLRRFIAAGPVSEDTATLEAVDEYLKIPRQYLGSLVLTYGVPSPGGTSKNIWPYITPARLGDWEALDEQLLLTSSNWGVYGADNCVISMPPVTRTRMAFRLPFAPLTSIPSHHEDTILQTLAYQFPTYENNIFSPLQRPEEPRVLQGYASIIWEFLATHFDSLFPEQA